MKNYVLVKKILSGTLLILGSASFFIFQSPVAVQIMIVLISLFFLYSILFRKSQNLFFAYYLVFTSVYALYGLLFAFNLPLSLLLLLLVVISVVSYYLFAEDAIGKKEFSLNQVLFAIIVSELFLSLSYWLINPITKSLVIMIFSYLFFGFTISKKDQQFNILEFKLYLIVSIVVFSLLIVTVL